MDKRRGLFIVVDGLDGIGKGEIERTLIQYEQKLGRAVFDSISFSRANRKGLPELRDFWNPPKTYFDTLLTSEPTYAGIGHIIRNEIIKKGSQYSYKTQIQAYSVDRLINMVRIIIPALRNNLRVIQSRSMVSTLCYQSLKAKEIGISINKVRREILNERGNKVQLEWAPDLLIIPTVKDVKKLMERIEKRKESHKDDNSIFDNLKFQERVQKFYLDPWLKRLFEKRGTKVEYLDAGISLQATKDQALEIYKRFLKEKMPSLYRS